MARGIGVFAIASALVGLLGCPDWATREAADSLLAALGRDAYPVARAGCRSEDPEVRFRCGGLLAGERARLHEARFRAAAAWWLDRQFPPTIPEVMALYREGDLRERIYLEYQCRSVESGEMFQSGYCAIRPGVTSRLDAWNVLSFANDLSQCRRAYGRRSWLWVDWGP